MLDSVFRSMSNRGAARQKETRMQQEGETNQPLLNSKQRKARSTHVKQTTMIQLSDVTSRAPLLDDTPSSRGNEISRSSWSRSEKASADEMKQPPMHKKQQSETKQREQPLHEATNSNQNPLHLCHENHTCLSECISNHDLIGLPPCTMGHMFPGRDTIKGLSIVHLEPWDEESIHHVYHTNVKTKTDAKIDSKYQGKSRMHYPDAKADTKIDPECQEGYHMQHLDKKHKMESNLSFQSVFQPLLDQLRLESMHHNEKGTTPCTLKAHFDFLVETLVERAMVLQQLHSHHVVHGHVNGSEFVRVYENNEKHHLRLIHLHQASYVRLHPASNKLQNHSAPESIGKKNQPRIRMNFATDSFGFGILIAQVLDAIQLVDIYQHILTLSIAERLAGFPFFFSDLSKKYRDARTKYALNPEVNQEMVHLAVSTRHELHHMFVGSLWCRIATQFETQEGARLSLPHNDVWQAFADMDPLVLIDSLLLQDKEWERKRAHYPWLPLMSVARNQAFVAYKTFEQDKDKQDKEKDQKRQRQSLNFCGLYSVHHTSNLNLVLWLIDHYAIAMNKDQLGIMSENLQDGVHQYLNELEQIRHAKTKILERFYCETLSDGQELNPLLSRFLLGVQREWMQEEDATNDVEWIKCVMDICPSWLNPMHVNQILDPLKSLTKQLKHTIFTMHDVLRIPGLKQVMSKYPHLSTSSTCLPLVLEFVLNREVQACSLESCLDWLHLILDQEERDMLHKFSATRIWARRHTRWQTTPSKNTSFLNKEDFMQEEERCFLDHDRRCFMSIYSYWESKYGVDRLEHVATCVGIDRVDCLHYLVRSCFQLVPSKRPSLKRIVKILQHGALCSFSSSYSASLSSSPLDSSSHSSLLQVQSTSNLQRAIRNCPSKLPIQCLNAIDDVSNLAFDCYVSTQTSVMSKNRAMFVIHQLLISSLVLWLSLMACETKSRQIQTILGQEGHKYLLYWCCFVTSYKRHIGLSNFPSDSKWNQEMIKTIGREKNDELSRVWSNIEHDMILNRVCILPCNRIPSNHFQHIHARVERMKLRLKPTCFRLSNWQKDKLILNILAIYLVLVVCTCIGCFVGILFTTHG